MMNAWAIVAAVACVAVLVLIWACIRISADKPQKRKPLKDGAVRQFLLMVAIFVSLLAAMAATVAVLMGGKLAMIRVIKDAAIPEWVKDILWGWY